MVVIGNNRQYLSALIIPDFETIDAVITLDGDAVSKCSEDAVIRLIQQDIAKLSTRLSGFEVVKKFHLLPDEFSIDGGELTPTLKLRRNEINKKYDHLIESMYNKK